MRKYAHPKLFAFLTQPLFQLIRALARARRVADDHHRKFSLHHGLIDINDAAISFSQYLRHARDNSGMINAKHRNDEAIWGPLT